MARPTFDEQRIAHEQDRMIGIALADAAWERGDRLSETERSALVHWSRWGSASYPVRKLGRGWTIEHPAISAAGFYPTKRVAVRAWELLIEKWIRMSGLEAYERHIKEHGAA